MKILKRPGKEKINLRTWVVAFYLLLAPLDFLPVMPGVSITRILIFIPISACLLHYKYMKIRSDIFFFFPVLYGTITMITMLYSYDISVTTQRTISIGLNIAVILIISMLSYNRNEIRIIKKAIVYSGWLTLILMVFYWDGNIMGGRITVVINGVYQDPNYLTGFLIFSILYYYDEFMQNRSKKSIVKMSFFLVSVLLTGSRGGLLAILGSALFYSLIWMKTKRFKFSSIVKIISFIFIMGILFNAVLDKLPDKVSQRYVTSFTLADGGAGRSNIWESTLYNYRSSPIFNKIFGYGAGTIRYFNYKGAVAHNIWIESLIEIGLMGTFIFFMFYFIYLKKAYKMKEYVVATSFMGYIIMGLSMSLYSYKPIWNILLLIIILKNSRYKIEAEIKRLDVYFLDKKDLAPN